MQRRRLLVGGAGVVGLVAAGVVGVELFAPERATVAAESAESGTRGTVTPLKRGRFAGADDLHEVTGTVTLARDDDGHLLRFEEYAQTQGPDVFLYLTPPGADPVTAAAVRAGVKVLVDGGADGGESTVTGSFTQRLAAEVDPDAAGGVSVWCDRFAVPFGSAVLEPVDA